MGVDVLVALLCDGPAVVFPSPEPQLYPVLVGPGTFYPAPVPLQGPHCAGCGYTLAHHEGDHRCPGLKTKTFQVPDPVVEVDWRTILAADLAAREVALHPEPYRPPVTPPPRIPARPPYDPGEFAGGQSRQAVGLGRAAMAAGWDVSPWYWLAGDGTEACAVSLAKGMMHAVATWQRPAGMLGSSKGWTVDVAYAWRTDVARIPMKLTHTRLGELLA